MIELVLSKNLDLEVCVFLYTFRTRRMPNVHLAFIPDADFTPGAGRCDVLIALGTYAKTFYETV